MLEGDPAEDMLDGLNIYECPDCARRTEAQGSCCCSDCGVQMQNISRPRHR